jgi:predicted ATPase
LPFLQQLAAHTKVVDMQSLVDYRTQSHATGGALILSPLSDETERALSAMVAEAADGAAFERLDVPVMMGRRLNVVATRTGVAQASFDELCNTEKGAADYKALSEHFHTVVLTNVPQLHMASHDQARRLILLIDELYEHRTRLLCSAQVAAEEIFQFDDAPLQGQAQALVDAEREKLKQREESEKQGIPSTSSWDAPVGGSSSYTPAKMAGLQVANLCALQDLKIAFKRAVSRLSEMQSDKYLGASAELRATRQQCLQKSLVKGE